MAGYNFGNGTGGVGDSNGSFIEGRLWYDTRLPTAVRDSDGRWPMIVTSIEVVASGRGGPRRLYATIGDGFNDNAQSGSDFDAPAGPKAEHVHRIPTFKVIEYGGENNRFARIHLGTRGGPFYHGRNGRGPGTVFGEGGFARGGSLAGGMIYAYSPSAPNMRAITSAPDGRSATVEMDAPRSDGESGIKGYRLQWSKYADFRELAGSYDVPLTSDIAGLDPNTRYYFRGVARNEVTDRVGSFGGPFSNTGVVDTSAGSLAGGKIYTGTGFAPARHRVYDGTRFVDAKAQVYNGTGWVNAR